GDFVVYHFHHASEEILVVLEGEPTLRTPAGERRLERGQVVHFPAGPDGAHALRNESDGPVRYLMASTLASPEVAEYPELKQMTAPARTGSQTGEHLWLSHSLEPDEPKEARRPRRVPWSRERRTDARPARLDLE